MDKKVAELEQRIAQLEATIKTLAEGKTGFFVHQSQIPNGTIKERHLVVTSTIAKGDIVYTDGNNNFTRLPIGTAGQKLTVSGGVPTWA